MNRHPWLLALTLGFGLAASPSQAAVLTFESATNSFGDFGTLPQGYGNRITSTSQNGYLYGLTGGATPNVVTNFATGAMAPLFTWSNDYGDLLHVAIAQEPRVFQLDLVADPGFQVTLTSFDMASWPHLNYTINSVQVFNQNGTALFTQNNPVILGSTSSQTQHTHFDFSGGGGLTGTTIRVQFDSTNVDSDDVGIDNITFSQSGQSAVPEPTSFLLAGLGFAGLTVWQWRRRRTVPATA